MTDDYLRQVRRQLADAQAELARVTEEWAQDVRSLDRIRSEWRQRDEQLKAALTTDEHHMTMWGGLPFCSCKLSLSGGDATGTWITHRLVAVRELLDTANSQSAPTSSQIGSCPDPVECGHEAELAAAQRVNASQMARLGALEDVEDRLHTAEARIAAVRALHERRTTLYSDRCSECFNPDYPEPWPCPTIAALDGPAEQPADSCRVLEVDGEPVRVRGAGELTPTGQAALAEVIRAAKRRYAAEHPEAEGPAAADVQRCRCGHGHTEHTAGACRACLYAGRRALSQHGYIAADGSS